MEVISGWNDVPHRLRYGACALGTFDGLHRGHQAVIHRAKEYASENGVPVIVFTFANHPRSVLSPAHAPLAIEDVRIRRLRLRRMGIDALFEPTFTKEIAAMHPKDFLALLEKTLAPVFVTAGPNYSFGRSGEGDSAMLTAQGKSFGFAAEICPAVYEDGQMISSSAIRDFIMRGQLEEANARLGHPVAICGEVMHGDARGRRLGFPTANLALLKHTVHLSDGVYAVRVTTDEKVYGGVANIGRNPTFDGMKTRLEVHLLHFSGDLYGKEIFVEFLSRLRGEEKFSSTAELVRQMEKDKADAEKILSFTRKKHCAII